MQVGLPHHAKLNVLQMFILVFLNHFPQWHATKAFKSHSVVEMYLPTPQPDLKLVYWFIISNLSQYIFSIFFESCFWLLGCCSLHSRQPSLCSQNVGFKLVNEHRAWIPSDCRLQALPVEHSLLYYKQAVSAICCSFCCLHPFGELHGKK